MHLSSAREWKRSHIKWCLQMSRMRESAERLVRELPPGEIVRVRGKWSAKSGDVAILRLDFRVGASSAVVSVEAFQFEGEWWMSRVMELEDGAAD